MHRPSRRGSGDARKAWARARGRGGERARAGRLARVRVGRGSERIPSGRVEHATTDTVVDLTTNGDSTGDLLTFHNELFDDANEIVVGTDQGECVRIEVGVSWECRWINFLEGGSITVEGPLFDEGPSAMAITGGTGVYRGARGSMRLVSRDAAGTEFDFVFRILTP